MDESAKKKPKTKPKKEPPTSQQSVSTPPVSNAINSAAVSASAASASTVTVPPNGPCFAATSPLRMADNGEPESLTTDLDIGFPDWSSANDPKWERSCENEYSLRPKKKVQNFVSAPPSWHSDHLCSQTLSLYM